MLIQFFQGFCMALADSVPGVSGGTVALILGFYERFINALHGLLQRDPAVRKAAFFYLAKLGIGWGTGFLASVLILAQLFETQIYFLSSLFLGLTLASIPYVIQEERRALRGHLRNIPFLLAGLLLVCAMAIFRNSPASSGAVNYLHLLPGQYVYLFCSGFLAIIAMVLPGVSGSTLLFIMGVYLPTIHAIHAFLYGSFAMLPGLIVLAAGILIGAAVAVRMVRAALRKYRSQMVYLVLGLMLGSLAAIAMGPTTLTVPQQALRPDNFQPVAFFLGVAVLVGLEALKKWMARREKAEQSAFMQPDPDA